MTARGRPQARASALAGGLAGALACLALLPLPAALAQSLSWGTPAPSTATPAPGRTPQASGDYLQRMDTDRDGRVSLVEYQDWLSYAFDGMDLDRDGVLSAREQPGGRARPITRDEHRARLAERFKRQDRDRNGFLDARELSAPPQ